MSLPLNVVQGSVRVFAWVQLAGRRIAFEWALNQMPAATVVQQRTLYWTPDVAWDGKYNKYYKQYDKQSRHWARLPLTLHRLMINTSRNQFNWGWKCARCKWKCLNRIKGWLSSVSFAHSTLDCAKWSIGDSFLFLFFVTKYFLHCCS